LAYGRGTFKQTKSGDVLMAQTIGDEGIYLKLKKPPPLVVVDCCETNRVLQEAHNTKYF